MQSTHETHNSQQAPARYRVLVIDDEESIRKAVGAVLSDEGFVVRLVPDGESGLAAIEQECPDAVMLDIWMPGLDGLEVLGLIKARWPALPVIMMSGHATIATAVKATRLGAIEFLEKPLDLSRIVKTVRAVSVTASLSSQGAAGTSSPDRISATELSHPRKLSSPAFSLQAMRGARRPQRTIRHSALLYGQGLHSGQKSGLILESLPPNSGVHFASVSEESIVPAHVDFVESTGFATTVRLDRTQAGTIEHLMSALHAYGISNILIKCNGEVPVLDGSAKEFCALLDEIGTIEQGSPNDPVDWFAIKVVEPVRIGNDKEFILLEPAERFSIDYTLRYPAPIGEQSFSFALDDIERYKREIAPARTFGFVKDIGYLQQQGLALGGRFDNFVLLGEEGAINTELRFPDEPVRHKILDAIGDLFLLGRPLQAKVTAQMTGHSDNVKLAQHVVALMRAQN